MNKLDLTQLGLEYQGKAWEGRATGHPLKPDMQLFAADQVCAGLMVKGGITPLAKAVSCNDGVTRYALTNIRELIEVLYPK